jgi:hypothetical protein
VINLEILRMRIYRIPSRDFLVIGGLYLLGKGWVSSGTGLEPAVKRNIAASDGKILSLEKDNASDANKLYLFPSSNRKNVIGKVTGNKAV